MSDTTDLGRVHSLEHTVAVLMARIELLEHVVIRMMDYDRTSRFDELTLVGRNESDERVPSRVTELLEEWGA